MSTIIPIALVHAGGRGSPGDQIEVTLGEVRLLSQGMLGTKRRATRPRPDLTQWEPGDLAHMFSLEWLPAPARAKLNRDSRSDDQYLALRFGDQAGSETWLFRGDRASIASADAALQDEELPVVLPEGPSTPRGDLRPAPLLVLAGVLAILGTFSLLASRGSDGNAGTAVADDDPIVTTGEVIEDLGTASPLAGTTLASVTAGLTRVLGERPTFGRIEVTRGTVTYDVHRPGAFDLLDRYEWSAGEFDGPRTVSVAEPEQLRDGLFVGNEVQFTAVPRLVDRLTDLRPAAQVQRVVIRRAPAGMRIFVNAIEDGRPQQLRASGSGTPL